METAKDRVVEGVKERRRCALCECAEPLEVDHCHASGQVRGLLCGRCNRALGLLDDNIEVLQRAIEYLSTG